MQISAIDNTTSSNESDDLSVILTPTTSETGESHDEVKQEWLFRGSVLEVKQRRIATSETALVTHRGKLWCAWKGAQDRSSPISWTSLNSNGTWDQARQVTIASGASEEPVLSTGPPAIADLNGILHLVFAESPRNRTLPAGCTSFHSTLVHLQYDDESQTWGKRASVGICGAFPDRVDTDTTTLMGYQGQLVCVYRSPRNEVTTLTWDDINGWSHNMTLPGVMRRSSKIALCLHRNELFLLCADRKNPTSIVRSFCYLQDESRWLPPTRADSRVDRTFSEHSIAYRDDHGQLLHKACLGEPRQALGFVHSQPCWNAPTLATVNGYIVCVWDGGPLDDKTLLWSQRVASGSIAMDKWMSRIECEVYLSELSIPGSHESCATIQVPWVQCQHMSIAEQLNAGIRYFDFRCGVYFGKLYLFHGRSPLGLWLNDVLAKMYAFLDRSPHEAIMVQVKMEGGSGDESVFEKLFLAELAENKKYWALGTVIPKLGTVRGKIQLMRRFHVSSGRVGIDVRRWADNSPQFTIPLVEDERLVVQDRYEFTDVVPTFAELIQTKSDAVNALIATAKSEKSRRAWYLNWCNAYALPLSLGVIATPADIAIGRNDFESGGRRRFFPGVNARLNDRFFSTETKGRFGTILLDYAETPAPQLVSSIVMTNTFI